MKISIFAPLFGKVGVEDAMSSLARELALAGDEAELIRTSHEWASSDSNSSHRVTNHRLVVQPVASRLPSRGWLLFRIASLLTAVAAVLPLAWYLFRKKPDVLIAAMMPTTAILAKWVSMSDTKLIVSVQGFPRPGKLRRFTWKLIWRSSDAIVTESNDLGEVIAHMAGLSSDQITTIYNPHLNPGAAGLSELEAPLLDNVPTAEFLVVAVGRLTRQKGFDTLINAMKLVSEKVDANLLILGEGELRGELEELARSLGIEGRVNMPGHTVNPYPYIKRADVLAVSSRWEGLARVPVEAQGLGTPVVANRIPGGMQEILMNGNAGVLVGKASPEELAAGILSVLSDTGLRARVTSEALNNIERFDPARCARRYRELIEALTT